MASLSAENASASSFAKGVLTAGSSASPAVPRRKKTIVAFPAGVSAIAAAPLAPSKSSARLLAKEEYFLADSLHEKEHIPLPCRRMLLIQQPLFNSLNLHLKTAQFALSSYGL